MSDHKHLLVISDAVSSSSGLARITRDLVSRIHATMGDVYHVATAGYGSPENKNLPWKQYDLKGIKEWILPTLPEIVEDFAGKERCIVMYVWDVSRTGWLSQPERLAAESLAEFPGLREWLLTANIEKWLYTPIDASGPNDRLSFPLSLSLLGFDRILAYGQFGEDVIRRTIGEQESNKRHLTHIPHGIDSSIFYRCDRAASRKYFLQDTGAKSLLSMLGINPRIEPIADDECLISIVATNQARKDFVLGIETVSILAKKGYKVRLWIHTNSLEHNWSIPSLLVDYGMLEKTVISLGVIPDDRMASAYSACDMSLGIGLGEGFGYPIFESIFCGTPCIHGNYAGAPQWINNPDLLVEPVSYRYEGSYACKRPVFSAQEWAEKILSFAGKTCSKNTEIDWNILWPKWEKWFRDGALLVKDVVTENVISLSRSSYTLDKVKELNYAHHKKMTRDHNATDESENECILKIDNDSYRSLLADIPKVKDVLELGSASGTQWSVLKEWGDNLSGVDLYEPFVETSIAKGKDIRLGFVEELPFSNESKDLVCSRHVMEHVSDIQKALAEIKRVLRPGGYVAAVTPHRFPDYEPAHIQQLRIAEWETEYQKAGFTVLSGDIREFNCTEAHIVARKDSN